MVKLLNNGWMRLYFVFIAAAVILVTMVILQGRPSFERAYFNLYATPPIGFDEKTYDYYAESIWRGLSSHAVSFHMPEEISYFMLSLRDDRMSKKDFQKIWKKEQRAKLPLLWIFIFCLSISSIVLLPVFCLCKTASWVYRGFSKHKTE